jgi:hypothetical protein
VSSYKQIVYAEVPVDEIVGKLVRNPGYNNNHVSLNNWCWVPHVSTHRKPLFQEALRESIRSEGIRNPIVVYRLTEGYFLSFGGSRLRAAREVGLARIPALVNDYTGEVKGPTVDAGNIAEFFTDPPSIVEWTDYGVDYHYGLERKRRDRYDPAGLEWAGDADFLSAEFPWIEEDS